MIIFVFSAIVGTYRIFFELLLANLSVGVKIPLVLIAPDIGKFTCCSKIVNLNYKKIFIRIWFFSYLNNLYCIGCKTRFRLIYFLSEPKKKNTKRQRYYILIFDFDGGVQYFSTFFFLFSYNIIFRRESYSIDVFLELVLTF